MSAVPSTHAAADAHVRLATGVPVAVAKSGTTTVDVVARKLARVALLWSTPHDCNPTVSACSAASSADAASSLLFVDRSRERAAAARKRAEQRRGGFDPCARSLQRETITVEMADKTKGAATNMEVTFANLQHGKRLKGKTRSRLHILVGLLFLGAVAGVAALIAKKGLPDIDPVKVRARSGIGPTACRAYTLVPTPRAPRRSPRSCR